MRVTSLHRVKIIGYMSCSLVSKRGDYTVLKNLITHGEFPFFPKKSLSILHTELIAIRILQFRKIIHSEYRPIDLKYKIFISSVCTIDAVIASKSNA